MDLPDQQQIEALIAGDETTFEIMFRAHYESLCKYAYTFLHDKDESEEIVQGTFLSFWEKRRALSIHTGVKPYLYAMVRNASLNIIKHRKIKETHAVNEIAMAPQSHDSVVRDIEGKELEARIQHAMNELPEQCRIVFKLSRFEELKYAEIAEQLNISIKTVENHMGKALRIMREQLRDYLPLLILLMVEQLKQQ